MQKFNLIFVGVFFYCSKNCKQIERKQAKDLLYKIYNSDSKASWFFIVAEYWMQKNYIIDFKTISHIIINVNKLKWNQKKHKTSKTNHTNGFEIQMIQINRITINSTLFLKYQRTGSVLILRNLCGVYIYNMSFCPMV